MNQSLIGQKYEVKAVLGKGGFGIVYWVYSRETHENYALKTFKDEFLTNAEARKLFQREAEVWVHLDHHINIIKAHFVDEVCGRLYLAMEYIEQDNFGRRTLTDYLGESLSLTQSLVWAIQFCHGMEYAYSKGLRCHRDIKPANIMITREKVLKVSDFGLASVLDAANSNTRSASDVSQGKVDASLSMLEGKVCGTPAYMAPEQFFDNSFCDQRSDVYSFGIVFFQMISGGKLPFEVRCDSREEIVSFRLQMFRLHCDEPVEYLDSPVFPFIQRCLAKDPNNRYQTFGELRKDLEIMLKQVTDRTEEAPKQIKLETIDLSNKGGALNSLGHFKEAIEACNEALEKNSLNINAWNNKGIALNNLHCFDKAIFCFDQALKLDPTDSDVLNNKGFSYMGKKNFSMANEFFDEALRFSPQYINAWSNKGSCILSMGDYPEALKCFSKVLSIDPQFLIAWFNKGVCHKQLRQLNDALFCYNEALKIDPQYIEALFNKGGILRELALFNEAMDLFDAVLKIDSKNANAWINKGICFKSLGKYLDALDSYDNALEIEPHSALAWFNKGLCYECMEDFIEAAKCYSKSAEFDPSHVQTWFRKGIAEDISEKTREAILSLKKFIELATPVFYREVEAARERIRQLEGT
jgi:tetratricopeptide (TPR) repeat protein